MKRIRKLREKMRKNGIDAAVFLSLEPIDDQNIYYFTGFQQERYHSFACYIVAQDKTVLILSGLDYERASGKEADEVVKKNAPLHIMLKRYIKKNQVVGIMERIFPYYLAKKLGRTKDITKIISEMRAVKDSEEIELLRKSCKIANRGIKFIKNNLREGISEREFALELERFLLKKADEMSFPTIVVSSLRSAQIHPYPSFSNQKIKRGLGYIDFGVRYGGYCSDVTVPFSVGKLTEKEKKIVDAALRAYKNSLNILKPGISASKLFSAADKTIKKEGFELKHGLGHGIGLDTHDFPSLSQGSAKGINKIKSGMVFTIEPGVYVPGIGGCRLENDFLMGKEKFEILTKSSFLDITL